MMLNDLQLPAALGIFAACACAVLFFGTKLTKTADQLADRTGLGEAIAGGVLLGATTSLPGIVVSVTAGLNGRADLALGNAVGGIAVQTLFLAVADLFYTRANLEHAAASLANMLQTALLVLLLGLIGLGQYMPDVTLLGAHPVSWILVMAYGYGLRMVALASAHPMWNPEATDETRSDEPEDQANTPRLGKLWLAFAPLALILAGLGWALELVATRIVELTALSESAAGLLLTATSTSLPELATSVAAVRRGALTLAIAGIVGGNTFDTLFCAAADFSYQEGSIYHQVNDDVSGWMMINVVMTAVVLLGLLRREKHGVAGIGVEGASIVVCYAAGLVTLAY